MKKTLTKVACLILVFAFCLSLSNVGVFAETEQDLALNKTSLSMLLGGSLETLSVLGAPAGVPIKWSSDDLRVARVSGGKVISVSEGTANITAEVGSTKLTCAVNVYTEDLLISNDVFIKDTDGNPIFAQCGSIYKYKEGEPYYWYGVNYGAAEPYYNSLKAGNGTPGANPNRTPTSVRCYSSYNLVDWKFESVICTMGQNGWPASGWFGRIGVVYHAQSDTYVLCGQGSGSQVFGFSSTPTGQFTYHGTDTVNDKLPDACDTARTGDQTVYYDNRTGKAYIVYCNDGVDDTTSYSAQNAWHTLPERGEVFIAELDTSNDYLSIGKAHKIYDTKVDTYYNLQREGGREANCIFYYDGWYYNAASGLAGWNVSPNFYMGGARSPMDKTYVNEVGLPNNMTPMRGSSSNFSHSSQVVGFVTVDTPVSAQAPKGQLVMGLGDRWAHQLGNHTGGHGMGYYVFAPLSFIDPDTAAPQTKEDEPKTPNPLQYRVNPTNKERLNPWVGQDSFYPFIPAGYPYNEWKRPEWDIPVFNSLSQFYMDIEAGTWEPGPNNNYLDNPEFEQDRIDKCVQHTLTDGTSVNYPVVQDYVNEPNGWKAQHIAGQTAQINYGGNRNSNARDKAWQLIAPGTTTQNWYSAWAGNMTWYHGYTKRNPGTDPYKTKTYQKVDVPDGLYNFYGWVRSSGGQEEAYVYVGENKANINTAIDEWTLVTLENVSITGGQVEVGFYSDAAADQWVFFDDFALIAANNPTDVSVKATNTKIVKGDDAKIAIKATSVYNANIFMIKGSYTGNLADVVAADGVRIISNNSTGGNINIVLGVANTFISGERDLVKLMFDTSAGNGASVNIASVEVSGLLDINDDDTSYEVNAKIAPNSAKVTVYDSIADICDINKDDKVSLADISLAMKYYTFSQGDANWDAAEKCDVTGDGVIDMADLIMILANFTV